VVDLQGVIMDTEVLMRFVIGVLIGACIWAIGNRARADTIPATPNTQTQPASYQTQSPTTKWGYWATGPFTFSTPLEACQAFAPSATGHYVVPNTSGTCAGSTSGYCCWYYQPNLGGNAGIVPAQSCPAGYALQGDQCVATSLGCPAGWTLSGSTCSQTTYSCPSGYTLSGTNCISDPPPAGSDRVMMSIPESASPGAGGCLDGVLYYFDEASNQYAYNGQQVWYGPARSSGQFCSGQPQASSGAPNTSCGPGQVPGTINGQPVCLGAGETNPVQKIETTTTTTTDPQGQPTGTTTTTTTTKDTGTGSTVTTTTRNPDGTTSTQTQNVGPNTNKPDVQRFCEQNPETSICRKSSWGGTCGAFACDGDAVQCAIAREIHQRDCALFDTPTALSTLGEQVASGADPQASQNPALEANRQTTNLSGSISEDTFLSPGGLVDQQFVVSPRLTVTLPWSQLNYYLSIMGGIVVAFALIFAARIVVGAR
jgi:hypothetical protein